MSSRTLPCSCRHSPTVRGAPSKPPRPNRRLPRTSGWSILGDAVLGAIVTDHMYQQYPHLLEGRLADACKAVVNAAALAGVASRLGIGPALLLGKGRDVSGRTREAVDPRRRARSRDRSRVPRRWMASRARLRAARDRRRHRCVGRGPRRPGLQEPAARACGAPRARRCRGTRSTSPDPTTPRSSPLVSPSG